MKKYLEITLLKEADPFSICDRLNGIRGIKASVVTFSTIRVWFNPKQICDKRVIKLVRTLSPRGGKRRTVQHIKEGYPPKDTEEVPSRSQQNKF